MASIRLCMIRPERYRAAEAVRISSIAAVIIGTAIPPRTTMSATTSRSSTRVKPAHRHAVPIPAHDAARPAVATTAGTRTPLLLRTRPIAALFGPDGHERLQLQEALLADAFHVHQFLRLIFEDNRL